MAKSDWIRIVHVAKSRTGIDEDAYRAILSTEGLASSKEISTLKQFISIMEVFKKLGFVHSARSSTAKGNKRAATVEGLPGYITKRQEYYIRGLWNLASRSKDEKSLKKIVKRIGKVDDLSFLPRRSATGIIQALRSICWKAGINPDRREG